MSSCLHFHFFLKQYSSSVRAGGSKAYVSRSGSFSMSVSFDPSSRTNCKNHPADWDRGGKLMNWEHCRSPLRQWQYEIRSTDHATFISMHPPLPLDMAVRPQSTSLLRVPRASPGKRRLALKCSRWTDVVGEWQQALVHFDSIILTRVHNQMQRHWTHCCTYMYSVAAVSPQMLTCMYVLMEHRHYP